jgi:hypothetical protein
MIVLSNNRRRSLFVHLIRNFSSTITFTELLINSFKKSLRRDASCDVSHIEL